MEYVLATLKAFVVGGILCAIGEFILLKTSLTPARILVIYVVAGVVLSALGLYMPLYEFAGAGASIPLTGFGHALAQGAVKAVEEMGILGAFLGGIRGTAGGISAAIIFGYLNAVIFTPKAKQ